MKPTMTAGESGCQLVDMKVYFLRNRKTKSKQPRTVQVWQLVNHWGNLGKHMAVYSVGEQS